MSTPQEWLNEPPRCHECQGEMDPQMGTLEYKIDDMVIVVEKVPMTVCTSCGKQLVPGIPALAIGNMVQEIIEAERAKPVTNRVTMDYREQEPGRQFAFA